ncbi:MAG: DUF58 domain-containing protein [Chloroflexota bacterium]
MTIPLRALASPKAAAYGSISAFGLLLALILGRPEPLALAAPFLLLLVAGFALAGQPTLEVSMHLDRERALEQETLSLDIELRRGNTTSTVELGLLLPAGIGTEGARRALRLADGEPRRLTFELACRHWGGYVLGEALFRVRGPFGLVMFDGSYHWRLPLRVYPRPEALRSVLRPFETQVFAGNELARGRGTGIEFADIREFASGDRLRQVNWPASTRHGRLYVNEQHPERNADVVLFLDTFNDVAGNDVAGAGLSTLDSTLRAAAAPAARYLERRDRVGLIGFGGTLRWLAPSMGLVQLYTIVEALLDTRVTLSYAWKDIDVIPARTLPPKATVVAITPLLDERSLRALFDLSRRGFALAVIEVNPLPLVASQPGDAGQMAYRLWRMKREALRCQYQRLGIPVVVWQPGDPLEAALMEVQAFRRYAHPVHA